MTLEEGRPETASRNRRAFLLAGGAAVISGLAGCTGDGDQQDSPAATESDTATDTPSPTATATVADGLSAHYTLDGDTPTDASGNGNDATINGDPDTGATGQVAGAYEFDGEDDFLSLPGFTPSDDSVSLACWVNLDDLGTTGDYEGTQFHFWGDGSPQFELVYFVRPDNSGSLEWWYYDGEETGVTETGEEPPIGEWAHIAGTYDDDNGEFALYLDGSEIGTASATIDASFNGDNNLVGDHPGEDRWLDGRIDEVRFYDRALSESEVQALASQSR